MRCLLTSQQVAGALDALRHKLEVLPPMPPLQDTQEQDQAEVQSNSPEAAGGADDAEDSIASPISLRIPVCGLHRAYLFVRHTLAQSLSDSCWQKLDFSGLMKAVDEVSEMDHELREVQKGDKMARQLNELSGPTRDVMIQSRMNRR